MTAAIARYEIADPVYKQQIFFCIGGNDKQLLKLITEVDGRLERDPGEFSDGIVITNRPDPDSAPTFWIWMRSFNGSVADYSFLTHEMVHLLQELLTWLEISLCPATTEPCAAFFECLFEQILNILRKRRTNAKAAKASSR